jgi:hypothetical protein
MQLTRQQVVKVLRRAGYPAEAEEASRSLPDPVTWDRLAQWGLRHGITKDQLISQLGGSP